MVSCQAGTCTRSERGKGAGHCDRWIGWRLCLVLRGRDGTDALEDLFNRKGLRGTGVTAIDITTAFADFDDYWLPFLGGQGSAPGYVASLDGAERSRLRDHLRERLPILPDGSLVLTARAWAVRAVVDG